MLQSDIGDIFRPSLRKSDPTIARIANPGREMANIAYCHHQKSAYYNQALLFAAMTSYLIAEKVKIQRRANIITILGFSKAHTKKFFTPYAI